MSLRVARLIPNADLRRQEESQGQQRQRQEREQKAAPDEDIARIPAPQEDRTSVTCRAWVGMISPVARNVAARHAFRQRQIAVGCCDPSFVSIDGETKKPRAPRDRHAPFSLVSTPCAFDAPGAGCYHLDAGWSSLVARWAHNPKVGGSNPPPATNLFSVLAGSTDFHLGQIRVTNTRY